MAHEMAHAAVSRRTPIPRYTMVPRTHVYTYNAEVWDLSIVQGPFSVGSCQPSVSRFAFSSLGWLLQPKSPLRIPLSLSLSLMAHSHQPLHPPRQDFEYELACDIRASFLWTPYPANLSAALAGWQPPNSSPDLVVMGNGLWPMLHSGDAAAFERELRDAARAATALASETPLLWMTIPSLVGRKVRACSVEQRQGVLGSCRLRSNTRGWLSWGGWLCGAHS
jgi:hypothetical protein